VSTETLVVSTLAESTTQESDEHPSCSHLDLETQETVSTTRATTKNNDFFIFKKIE